MISPALLATHSTALWLFAIARLSFSYLSLPGLSTITPEVAQAFAKRKGRLYFGGLTTITPEVAEALAKHEGYLSLDDLTTISPEVAEALAKHEGRLSLEGLTSLTPEALKILRANPDIRLSSKFDEKP